MRDIIFRVALNSLENTQLPKSPKEIELALYKGLDLIKENKIRDVKDFFLYLEKAQINQKQFADAVSGIIRSKKPHRIISLGLLLGDGVNNSGIGLLKKTWWERNLNDEILRKSLAPKWWVLFRDKKWLEKNKVTK